MSRLSLVENLLVQAESQLDSGPAGRIHIQVGALSNISPAALARQFARVAGGSALDGAELVLHLGTDPLASDALAVRVLRVDRVA